MLHKIQKQNNPKITNVSEHWASSTSHRFALNILRRERVRGTSPALRGALALFRWQLNQTFYKKNQNALQVRCFITGRGRGIQRRFSISRTKIKDFSNQGKLFGVRKSSW